MKSTLIANLFVISLMEQLSVQYRRGRTIFEKRIEDVYWDSMTSCEDFHYCQNRRIRSWISSTSLKVRKTCAATFKNDRWGCHVDSKTFNKVTKEAAALYALLSSGLAHQASINVATRRTIGQELRAAFFRGQKDKNFAVSCIKRGLRSSKTFLALKIPNKTMEHHLQARLHNAALGLKVFEESVGQSCLCHGFSGSCSLKTCWRTLPQFSVVAEKIRIKFLFTHIIEEQNWNPHSLLLPENDFLVLEDSDDFCPHLHGKQCNSLKHCQKFCCPLGAFFNTTQTRYFYCNCTWAPNYELKCQICTKQITVHYCV